MIFGQLSPAATTDGTLWTVGANKRHTANLIVTNRNATQVKIRIGLLKSGGSIAAGLNDEKAIFYDLPIEANDSLEVVVGLVLDAGDSVRVRSDTANVNFNAFGIQEDV